MAGFNLYIGNRMEVLAEQLAEVLREPRTAGNPLEFEINPRRGLRLSIQLDN